MRAARRTFLASAAAAIAAPAVMRLARADAPITLKLHHFQSSVSSGHDKFLAPWARKVEAESGGRIRIDIFPSMQLGGAPAQLFDQARDGVVDIAWTVPALTPGRFPKIEMFELPFVPARRALVSSKALQDFAAINLNDEFREVHTDLILVHRSRRGACQSIRSDDRRCQRFEIARADAICRRGGARARCASRADADRAAAAGNHPARCRRLRRSLAHGAAAAA